MRSFSSELPTTPPAASSITKAGCVICGWSRKLPTLPTKMPRSPADSCRCHHFTVWSRPKKVALSRPCPSVSVTSSRELGARRLPV